MTRIMPHSSPELYIPASPAADAPPSTDVDISSMSQLRKNSGQTQFSKRPNYIESSSAPRAQRIISRDSQNEDENGSKKSKQPLSFAHWTRQALVHVLVQYNVELRREAELPHGYLVHICNTYFANKPAPLIPEPWPVELQVSAETAACSIQRAWIRHVATRRKKSMLAHQTSDRALRAEGILSPPGSSDAKALHAAADCPTPLAAGRELEQPWYPPDLELARDYAEWNHPRMGGPGGPLFPLCKTSTGRYCVLGGCGEQLDLWDEGQVSELSIYGSSISNFFKFEKWCAWTSLCLFFIYLPVFLLNTFGSGEPAHGTGRLVSLTRTTLGNLFQTLESRQGTAVLPICESLTRHYPSAIDCTLSEAQTAMMFTHTELAACIFLYVALSWLQLFQKKESQYLDRYTVTAGNYTVQITNIPVNVTEADIKVHFARTLNLPVMQVTLGYNNAPKIEKQKLRGSLMKRRHLVVNRCRYLNQQLACNGVGDNDRARDCSRKIADSLERATHWWWRRELQGLKQENERLLARLSALNAKLGATHEEIRPLCAFVTFNSEAARNEALRAYGLSSLHFLCMPHGLRLAGHRLRVTPAPEPSLILWENLQYGRMARFRRQLLTTMLAGLLISLPLIFAFVARYYQDQGRRQQEGGQEGSGNGGRDTHHAEGLAAFWTVVATFSTIGSNYLIQLVLQWMTEFEKAHTVDIQQFGRSMQLFVLKSVNMAGIVLVVNFKVIQKSLHIKINEPGNFVKEWYYTTGCNLLLIMFINVVSPLLPSLKSYCAQWHAQRKAARGQFTGSITQSAANNVFIGPEFAIAIRYSSILVTFFVCFAYATAMPLLLLIGAASFYVGYWVDKFLFLRFNRIPLEYGKVLSKGAIKVIQVALLFHVIISIWALSQDELFPSSTETNSPLGRAVRSGTAWMHRSIARRLQKAHIQPLVILFLVLAIVMIGRALLKSVFTILCSLFRVFANCNRTCHTQNDDEYIEKGGCKCSFFGEVNGLDEFASIDVTYPRAIERGLIKGLHTYNILANPRYKSAFRISDSFAKQHRHVESIRGSFEAHSDGEESDGQIDEDEEGGVVAAEDKYLEYECHANAVPNGLLLVSPLPNAPPPPSTPHG